jgi:hypothetical protein
VKGAVVPISAQNLCRLAGELAEEHGVLAVDYARRAYRTMEYAGNTDRAQFWFSLSILVDDVITHRIDPDSVPSIQ